MNYNLVKLIYHGLHIDIGTRNTFYHNENIYNLLKKMARSVLSGKIYFPLTSRANNFFYFGTPNQFQALSKIHQRCISSSVTYYHGHNLEFQEKNTRKYPFWISYAFGLISRIFFFKFINKISDRFQKINPHIPYHYAISVLIGQYFVAKMLLKLNHPKYLWLSNDHTNLNVAMLYAAKSLRIKTIYVQHASVSFIFPPLNFDFAFLDGRVAYGIYKRIGVCGTRCFLSGISKMDGFINRYSPPMGNKKVLLCINQTDDISALDRLIDTLIESGFKIKVRKHPFFNGSLHNEYRIEICREKVFMRALADVDFLIAGDSNVHLEATLTNVPCFYISTSHHFDYYRFLKYGVVVWGGRDIEECVDKVQNYKFEEDVYLRAEPYCASVGSEYQNQSTTYILDKIRCQ